MDSRNIIDDGVRDLNWAVVVRSAGAVELPANELVKDAIAVISTGGDASVVFNARPPKIVETKSLLEITAGFINYAASIKNNSLEIGEKLISGWEIAGAILDCFGEGRTITEVTTAAFGKLRIANIYSLTVEAERNWRSNTMQFLGVWRNAFTRDVPSEALMRKLFKLQLKRIAGCREGIGPLWRADNSNESRRFTTDEGLAWRQARDLKLSERFFPDSGTPDDDIPF